MGNEIKPVLKADISKTLDKLKVGDFVNFPASRASLDAIRIAVFRRQETYTVQRARKSTNVKRTR